MRLSDELTKAGEDNKRLLDYQLHNLAVRVKAMEIGNDVLLEEVNKLRAEKAEMVELLKQARLNYLEQNGDGESDCVTPYDAAFYGGEKCATQNQ